MKLLPVLLSAVLGHGRLMDPPGRSSYRLFKDDPTIGPFVSESDYNYNDNELYCGGFMHQVNQGYKCGICGDPFDSVRPRNNEWGGKYGSTGLIPRSYEQGATIDIEVQLTAHHMGWFEFKLCPMGIHDTTEPDWCFSSKDSLLQFSDSSTRWDIPSQSEGNVAGKTGWWYKRAVKLPDGLTCDHCVLQWHWHTANSWACDEAGNCGLGYGEQEEFYGCSDLSIVPNGAPTSTIATPDTTKPTTTKSTTTKSTTQTSKATTTSGSSESPTNVKEFCSQNGEGIFPHPTDCSAFIQCTAWDGSISFCAPGLAFNADILGCDWPQNVDCDL